jgi:glycosyltransferase involved in cell wall biosynthesis
MAAANTPMPANAAQEWIALLGRRDEPTDGVEDYCTFLARALAPRGVNLRQVRVNWDKQGWLGGLSGLRRDSANWRDKPVVLQYTAMAWSRRGFPLGALAALAILRRSGVRCAVMFHEPFRQTLGRRLIDRLRGVCQDSVVRRLYARADAAIFADPLENIPWLLEHHAKAFFIPIGANIPIPSDRLSSAAGSADTRTVCVFCFSDPPNRDPEVDDIASAVRAAAMQGIKLRLILIGRGTAEAKERIEAALSGTPVELIVLGIRPAEEVSRTLADSDAMLCVRGSLYPRRGSALAGIACGLPIIGFSGAAQGTLLEEAGIQLVPKGDRKALGLALIRVLRDQALRTELHNRSVCAHEQFFSWDQIARRYIDALEPGTSSSATTNRQAERS